MRAQILLQDDGAVGVILTDGAGAKRVDITVLADGHALVSLYDKNGNPANGNERTPRGFTIKLTPTHLHATPGSTIVMA
jgi:hypothetical protein